LSHANLVGREIADDDRAGADDGEFADGYAWTHEDIGGKPGVFTDDNGRGDERHVPVVEIVRAGAEVAVLAEVGATVERDASEVVESDAGANHGSRSEGEEPREGDPGRGEHDDLVRCGNVGAEKAQEAGAETVEWAWAPAKNGRLHESP
jgi:hypothetical protein